MTCQSLVGVSQLKSLISAFKLNYEVELHTKPIQLQDFNVISSSSSEKGSSSQNPNNDVGEDSMSNCSEAGEDIPFESEYDAALAAKLSYEHLASLTMVGDKSAEPNKYQQNGKTIYGFEVF